MMREEQRVAEAVQINAYAHVYRIARENKSES